MKKREEKRSLSKEVKGIFIHFELYTESGVLIEDFIEIDQPLTEIMKRIEYLIRKVLIALEKFVGKIEEK